MHFGPTPDSQHLEHLPIARPALGCSLFMYYACCSQGGVTGTEGGGVHVNSGTTVTFNACSIYFNSADYVCASTP